MWQRGGSRNVSNGVANGAMAVISYAATAGNDQLIYVSVTGSVSASMAQCLNVYLFNGSCVQAQCLLMQ